MASGPQASRTKAFFNASDLASPASYGSFHSVEKYEPDDETLVRQVAQLKRDNEHLRSYCKL